MCRKFHVQTVHEFLPLSKPVNWFKPNIPSLYPWKRQKIFVFPTFPGGIKMEHRGEINEEIKNDIKRSWYQRHIGYLCICDILVIIIWSFQRNLLSQICSITFNIISVMWVELLQIEKLCVCKNLLILLPMRSMVRNLTLIHHNDSKCIVQ